MHLTLLRHGETDWNLEGRTQGRIDVPLNARGIEQANKLARRLAAEEKVDWLYTSPLVRARATADIIGNQVGLAPVPELRLVERCAGSIEGLTLDEFEQSYPEVYQAWRNDKERLVLPGAETRDEFQQRVSSFLNQMRARHKGARVALVTHGGTLGMLVATLIGWELHRRFPFHFDNASITRIDLSGALARVEVLNDTCHLRTDGDAARTLASEASLAEPEILSALETN